MKKFVYGMSIVTMVVMMSLVCSCGNGSQKQGEASEDSLAVSTETKETPSDPFVGKTYSGSGNGGGLYTEMTISFLADNKCACVSDWYQAYSTKKELHGNYEVKGKQVFVHCKNDNINYDFEFDVKENGRVIEFNHFDPSMGGTMGNDYMMLELQGEEAKATAKPIKYYLKGTKDGFMDVDNIEMTLTVHPADTKGVSQVECILHILSPEGSVEGTNHLKGTLKGKKLEFSQKNESGAVSYEGIFDGKSYNGEYSVMSVKVYGGAFSLDVK